MPEDNRRGRKQADRDKASSRRFQAINDPENHWLDRLVWLNTHFGRFSQDILGVFLLVFSLLTLLALSGISEGEWLKPWADLLSVWFGWGSYLLGLALGLVGFGFLRRGREPSSHGWPSLRIGRLTAANLFLLLTLGLLSMVGRNSVELLDTGMYGGRIGWGLAVLAWMLAGEFWGTFLMVVLWLVLGMGALGLWRSLEKGLLRIAGELPDQALDLDAAAPAEVAAAGESTVAEKPPRKKKSSPLPPEFRKSLPVPETVDNRPAKPPPRDERFPPLTLLSGEQAARPDERTINQTAGMIEKTLSEFGIPATVIGFRTGPTVTQFAVQPGFIKKVGSEDDRAQQMKVRVAQIARLQKDLALALSAQRLRIQAPVPGKPYVGIEVPNTNSAVVRLRPILESESFVNVKSPLAIALGRDVSGNPLVADLSRMPHLLIAGATGAGKSVCITSIAACLVMNNAPEKLRLVMIDSKMVELLRYNGLPHLYGKVETNIERIMGVLRWVVVEMERRYRLLEGAKARDLDVYNRKLERQGQADPLPRIVVIIDEMADLMMSAPDQTEHSLVRLAQMARATGIHLVVATQRPSTDVVTGLIKANFPARMAFAVASGVDSRVILDTGGAETLLGRGDMLFLNPEVGNPVRAQGVMVTDQEIEKIVTHWQKTSDLPPEIAPPWEKLLQEPSEDSDEVLVEEAVGIVQSTGRASASLLQRKLRIGYPRAARLLDRLEDMGVVGPALGGGRERDVLIEPGDGPSEESS